MSTTVKPTVPEPVPAPMFTEELGRAPDPDEFSVGLREWLASHTALLQHFREVIPLTIETRDALLRPLHRLLYDVGWIRWGWPADVGGFGGSVLLRGILHEELCRFGMRLPESMLLLETLAPVVIEYDRPLAKRFVNELISGNKTWAQGFSEPEAGSDLASLRCSAQRDDRDYVINGEKIWSSSGHLADRCLLLARTGHPEERHRGLTFLLVDLDAPGITVRPISAASGRNEFAEIVFQDVRVSAERIVGQVGSGWEAAMYLLQWERGMYAWQRQADLHSVLGEALAEPELARGAATDERIGAAYRILHALRMATRRTLGSLARAVNPGPGISVDKLLLSKVEQAVFEVVRELRYQAFEFGDRPADDALRADYFYARAASIYGGSAEIQRTILADRVLQLPGEKG
ncbi:acyl-CoA dehydrogenase family protein [Mycolicibacterium sp. XJ879]